MNIEAIRARADAATPAPWLLDNDGGIRGNGNKIVADCNPVIRNGELWSDGIRYPNINDKEFIAHAREDIPALLAENKALRNELCVKCGRYSEEHFGACNGCKWAVKEGNT